jgi:hypothetical protein
MNSTLRKIAINARNNQLKALSIVFTAVDEVADWYWTADRCSFQVHRIYPSGSSLEKTNKIIPEM